MTTTEIQSGWRFCELGDVITLQRGHDLPERNRRDGAVPIVSSSGPTGLHNETKARGPGVVTGRYGTLGEVFYVEDDYWPLNTTLYVKDFKGNNPRFVAYFLKTMNLERFNGAGAVPGLNRNHLHKLRIRFPANTNIQEEIVAHLSHFDSLIETNRRRLALLEEAAQQLYNEWFVRLRFPGHADTDIVDGLPKGWDRVPVSAICTVGRGASPRPINNYMGGSVPWFKIADATASESPFVLSTKELVTEDGAAKSVFLPVGELILSNSATCGIPYFLGVSGCIHDGWLYFKGLNRVSKHFLYCYLHAKQREIVLGIGDGSTQKNLNTTYIGKQTLLLPKDNHLVDKMSALLAPMFNQVFVLARHNQQLSEARDLLLPRLMSGEIHV